MTVRSRANVVSSFTVIKGAMIAETYAAFAGWDLSRSKRENLDRLRDRGQECDVASRRRMGPQ